MKTFALVICLTFLSAIPGLPAVRGSQVMYVGGTYTTVPEKTEGRFSTAEPESALFSAKKVKIAIPYKGITSIEYGQKAGRRVGVALAVSPLALFSKKRKHFVSLTFTDVEGQKQGVVFEFSKGTVHSVVGILETRSGRTVEFESEDARKHFAKEAK